MLFHHGSFWLFFAAFAAAYFLCRSNIRARNLLVVGGSYLFYAGWDWRFLGLIVFSTLLDYAAGIGIGSARSDGRRRAWLWASVAGNLGVLGFFKYWNFFQENAAALLTTLGLTPHAFTLNVVLPVGISFYTFQTMSYTLDVYARRIEPTRDLAAFAAYVAFFPQLVAGPIERARNLLPQFLTPRILTADGLRSGLDLIIWGLFKKIVIADQLAPFVDLVFGLDRAHGALTAAATIAFGFQIYADFSGYSDIARGLARLMGFELMLNFNRPYLAASLRAFWRRWHISLSTWLRDYLYIPLGGNREGVARAIRNLLFTMTLGGLWHGAAWHFVVWGVWHGIGLAAERWFPRLASRWVALTWVFAGWFLFRVPGLNHAPGLLTGNEWPAWAPDFLLPSALLIAALLVLESRQPENSGESPARGFQCPALVSGILLVLALACARPDAPAFMYFQF